MDHEVSASDRAFRRSFEACETAPEEFDHAAHVRLAYIYLCEHTTERAVDAMRSSLLAFLEHLGIGASKYHETMTRAWIMAVRHFMDVSDHCTSSSDFIEKNPRLLDSKIMLTHYSAEVLFSQEARGKFVQPDIQPIP